MPGELAIGSTSLRGPTVSSPFRENGFLAFLPALPASTGPASGPKPSTARCCAEASHGRSKASRHRGLFAPWMLRGRRCCSRPSRHTGHRPALAEGPRMRRRSPDKKKLQVASLAVLEQKDPCWHKPIPEICLDHSNQKQHELSTMPCSNHQGPQFIADLGIIADCRQETIGSLVSRKQQKGSFS